MVVFVGLDAKRLNLPVIVVVSLEHCSASAPLHSSVRNLTDIAGIVLDNCRPAGNALVRVPGFKYLVGPGSTIGAAAVTNTLE